MEKAVYYGRVSTEEEKQANALEKQVLELETFINNNENMILVDAYVDKGKSGTTRKGRKQYNRLFDDLLTDKFDTVVIKDQSRLMRNVLDWYLFLDRLTKHNKRLFLYMENQYYTPENAFISGIRAMMAEEQSKDLSKKIKQSVKNSHAKGVVYGNGKLWGYNQKNGKLEINEEEAKIVRLIFELYSQNNGVRKIIKKLDELGIKNQNGNHFSPTTIKRMIRQPKYKGTLISGVTKKDFITKKTAFTDDDDWIVHEGIIPAIVSEDLWEKANALYDKKSKLVKKEDKEKIYGYFSGEYVFSGKIVCMKCGKTYWHSAYQNTKRYTDIWQCQTYRSLGKKNGCFNTTLQTSALYEIIRDIIFDVWEHKNEVYEIIELSLKSAISQHNPQYNNEASMLTNQIKKTMVRKDNLLNAFLDGDIDKVTYNRKKLDFEEELSKLQLELDRITNLVGEIESKIKRIEKMKKEFDLVANDKNNISDEIIDTLLNKIEVDGDKMKVILNMGLEKEVKISNYQKVSANVKYWSQTESLINDKKVLIDIYFAV